MPAATFSSRTTGVPPLPVFFSACDWGAPAYSSGVDQPAGGTDFHKWHYHWEFDDPGSGLWPDGRSKNEEIGFTAAHVFETPGTYTVTLTVTDDVGNITVWTQDVVVSAFSGTTYYFSTAGNDGNDGLTEGTPKQTIGHMMTLLATNRRFLFKRGEVFVNNAGRNFNVAGPIIVGAYGAGAIPIWRNTIDDDQVYISEDDLRFENIRFEQTVASPVNSTGIQFNGGAGLRDNLLLHNVEINGHRINFSGGNVAESLHDGVFVMGGALTNADEYCLFMEARRFAVVGCTLGPVVENQHVMRSGSWHHGVIAHCSISETAHNTCAKIHSPLNASATPRTKFLSIYANTWTGAVSSLDLRPQNETSDERLDQVIVDSNRFIATANTTFGLFISAKYVTARNNIHDGTLSNDYVGVAIDQRGIEPAFDQIFIVNNTMYSGGAGANFKAVAVENSGTNVLLQNNLSSAPGVATDVFLDGTCVGLVETTNRHDDTSGMVDPGAGDYSLAEGSPARNAGTATVIARIDHEGNARPDVSLYDIGAFEFTVDGEVESLTEDIMSMISEKPRHKALQSLVSMALADDGCYFKAVNPTPGTGIAQAITAAFSGTAGLLCLGNPATSDRLYYPEYIRLIPTVVPASATRSELLLAIDSILRYSSGGSTLTPRNARMGSDGASQADVKVGALVLAAESGNVRRLSRAQLRAAIPVAFEEFLIKFGSIDHTESTLGGATAVRGMVNVGPVVIEPGHSMAVHVWHPSNAVTGASWEVEVAWYERKK